MKSNNWNNAFRIEPDEYDGKVVYGQKQKAAGSG